MVRGDVAGRVLTDEERSKVEDLVNQKIKENLNISLEEMDIEQAKKDLAEEEMKGEGTAY